MRFALRLTAYCGLLLLAGALLTVGAVPASASELPGASIGSKRSSDLPTRLSGVRASQEEDEEARREVSLADLREEAGLEPVQVTNSGPLVDALNTWLELAGRPNSVEEPVDVPDTVPFCGCNWLEMRGDQVAFVTPKELLARSGIEGNFVAWDIEGDSLERLDGEQAAPLLYDPRLEELAVKVEEVADSQGSYKRMILFGRLADRGFEAQTVPRQVDAATGLDLRFISPQTSSMRLERKSPGGWRALYSGPLGDQGNQRQAGFQGLQFSKFPGVESRGFVFAEGLSLGINQKYRITIANGQQIGFTTRKHPGMQRTWTFKGSAIRPYRKAFLREIRRLDPTMRRIAKQLDGYLTIKAIKGGGNSVFSYNSEIEGSLKPSAWGTITFTTGMLSTAAGRREVIAHEFAHAVDLLGMTSADRKVIGKMARKSKKWRNCKPNRRPGPWQLYPRWPCIEDVEIRAEVMAFASTRGHDHSNTGYGVPTRLLSGSKVRRWYRDAFALTSRYRYGADVTEPDWLDESCSSLENNSCCGK